MSDYAPPLRDIRFVLEHVADLPGLARLDDFGHADLDTVTMLLDEAGRFAAEVVAPTNRDGDREHSVLDGEGGVRTPESFSKAYGSWVDAGWGSLGHPADVGGGGFPQVVANAVREMTTAGNAALMLCPMLTSSVVLAVRSHGSEQQRRRYLPELVSGQWAGTMVLTEPQAGSDVGAITTRAEPVGDGSYRLTGTKIFISWGDQDLTEQIVHAVLARVPGGPPGTRGLSLFLVPKFVVNADGSLGERNDVRVVSVEDKLGLHGSPTCVVAYGEQSGGAVAELVGEVHGGMRLMFTMMNDARLGIGMQALAIAERAYQQARAYAHERRQGVAPGEEGQTAIVAHADVRRMLLTAKAYVEAMRCLSYATGAAIDRAGRHPDADVRAEQRKLADLLTPLAKAWCTDMAVEVTSLVLQVHGGMGYITETGVAQHYRDARIAPIYEGTNGIQALDLVGRKLRYDGGSFVDGFVAGIRATAQRQAGGRDELVAIGEQLVEAVGVVGEATAWIADAHGDQGRDDDVAAAATPYLRLLATVVGGWYLARSAEAALDELDTGADEPYLRDKVTTARFYATQLLPQATGLLGAVTAGAGDLYAADLD